MKPCGTCGTCIHYRQIEDYISPASVATVTEEYCGLDYTKLCAYCLPGCANYQPDQNYIDFMGFDSETTDYFA